MAVTWTLELTYVEVCLMKMKGWMEPKSFQLCGKRRDGPYLAYVEILPHSFSFSFVV